jgi:hypothetical protein
MLIMDKETILVEQFVCEDPLCGGELFQLIEKKLGERYTYSARYPMGEEAEIQSSSEKLNDEQIFKLLNQTNWLHADISLKNADISGVEDIPSLLEGDFPLFTIGGSMPDAELRFREWVESWFKRHRELVD